MSVVGRVRAALSLDVAMAWRHLVLNVVAGSAFVPRPARAAVYRAYGLDVRSRNVFSGVRITGRNLYIGRGTFVNHECYLDVGQGRIEIGEGCHLAPGVMVLTATHAVEDSGRVGREAEYRTTVIEDHVWLGARAVVLPGVRIGAGSIIAAGAVVTRSCEPGGMYGGVPAHRLRGAGARSDGGV